MYDFIINVFFFLLALFSVCNLFRSLTNDATLRAVHLPKLMLYSPPLSRYIW